MPDLSWVDWGSAPAWGALVSGTAAAIFTGRNVWHDRRDRRLIQAGKVAAWWGQSEERAGRGFPQFSAGAFLQNSSDVPVYDVQVEWLQHGGAVVGTHTERVLPPTSAPRFVHVLRAYSSGDADGEERYNRTQGVLQAVAAVDGGLAVRLAFRDASGRTWHRSETGKLSGGR